jgi:phosphoglucosamine mutase
MGRYFGTDGIRGLAGDKLTAQIAYRVGRYLGAYQHQKQTIVIGMDTRLSSPMLSSALISGITSAGSDVVLLGVATTPMVSFCMMHFQFSFGVMISASHNPYFDNGIKVFNAKGEKLEASIESDIETFIDQETDHFDHKTNQEIGRVLNEPTSYVDAYVEFLVSLTKGNFSTLKLCIDASHGSASTIAKRVFDRLGCSVDLHFASPNGVNINDHCGATHMQTIADLVKKQTYDLGISFDGDADRMLAVTPTGQLIDGDALLYLHAKYTLPSYPDHQRKVVLTKMSNLGLKKQLIRLNIPFIEVDVGDKYVQAALKDQHLILGGEQSGHVIFLDVLNTGDGLISALKLLQILINHQQDIATLLGDFVSYPQVLKNVIVQNKRAIFEHPEYKPLLASIEQQLGDEGRILVRASGTEPLIRVMVEAKQLIDCHTYVEKVVSWIHETLTY